MNTNSPQPLEVHVQVFIHPGESNGDFHFESTDIPMGLKNHLYFRNFGYPGFYVHYDIQGTDYVFPDAKMAGDYLNEALFCHAQTMCPTTKSVWGQFTAIEVLPGGKTLVVHNKNDAKNNFAYALRVTKDNGSNYLPLDPGGTNWNGSLALNKSTLTVAAFAGAVVGVLATLGVQAFLAG